MPTSREGFSITLRWPVKDHSKPIFMVPRLVIHGERARVLDNLGKDCKANNVEAAQDPFKRSLRFIAMVHFPGE